MNVEHKDDAIKAKGHDGEQGLDDVAEVLEVYKAEYEGGVPPVKSAISDEVMAIVNEHVFVNGDGTLSIIDDLEAGMCVYGPPTWEEPEPYDPNNLYDPYDPNNVVIDDEPDVYGPLPSVIDADEQ